MSESIRVPENPNDIDAIQKYFQAIMDSKLELEEKMDLIEDFVLDHRELYFQESTPAELIFIYAIFLFNEWDDDEKRDFILDNLSF